MEQVLDQPQLGVPAQQRSFQPVDPLGAADAGQHPGSRPQPHRVALALQVVFAAVGESDRRRRKPVGGLVHPDLSWRCARLDPGRGVHRIARRHALADRAQGDRHLPGHHSHPGRQVRNACLRTQHRHGIEQFQPGAHRPFRVVLTRDRGTPDCHHRITDELLHHPAVAVDHGPRRVEVARQQLSDLLRIPRLRQRREPHQIGEQHRTHPPFRHRTNRAANRAGRPHRTGGRAPWEHEAHRRGSYCCLDNPCTTLTAELLTRGDSNPARRARSGQGGPTFAAELPGHRVLRAAGPAGHFHPGFPSIK